MHIETLADGHVNEMNVCLNGTISALFLKDLGQKTRHGQMGRLKAGRIPGGESYRYDVIPSVDDRGRRVIKQTEAAIVLRIYAGHAHRRSRHLAQAQQVRAVRGMRQQKMHTQRRPKRLLSGLVYRGFCGAKYNIATQHFMRCSAHTNSGPRLNELAA